VPGGFDVFFTRFAGVGAGGEESNLSPCCCNVRASTRSYIAEHYRVGCVEIGARKVDAATSSISCLWWARVQGMSARCQEQYQLSQANGCNGVVGV